MTAILLIWDLKTNRVAIANGGGVPILHFHQSTNETEVISLDSNPLGISQGDGFLVADHHLELQSGDFLFLQTDGMIEAANREGTLFDDYLSQKKVIAELKAERSAGQVIEALLAKVKDFTESADFADDVTLIALKNRGS